MRRKTKINWVALGVIIAGIGLLITFIIYLPQIKENMPDVNRDNFPFTIKISPEYFDEGNYDYDDKIPFSIEIAKKTGRNVTYAELSKVNFKISRKDEGLNKPTSNVYWKNSKSDKILSFGSQNPSYYSYFPSILKAEGEMNSCSNCFIGTSYPYLFTFTIYYKENGGELKYETFDEIVPIK